MVTSSLVARLPDVTWSSQASAFTAPKGNTRTHLPLFLASIGLDLAACMNPCPSSLSWVLATRDTSWNLRLFLTVPIMLFMLAAHFLQSPYWSPNLKFLEYMPPSSSSAAIPCNSNFQLIPPPPLIPLLSLLQRMHE